MRPPCKGCEDRTADPNCHTNCKRYCEYRAWKDERNAEKFATCGSSCICGRKEIALQYCPHCGEKLNASSAG